MSENSKITVKLKKAGWEIEISCAENQLQKAIESVLSSLPEGRTPQAGLVSDETQRAGTKKTVRALLLDLWQENWFEDSRSLSNVHEEIARRGYHYDRSAVSHSLTDLVKESILSRQGNTRTYSYIQKKPPITPRLAEHPENESLGSDTPSDDSLKENSSFPAKFSC
jgi:hypothetical protein